MTEPAAEPLLKTEPFWREAAPLEAPSEAPAPLPKRVDVVVIGAGYTGLCCARRLAAAGRSVLAIDAGPIGAGASARNGGMIGWGHRGKFDQLAKRYGTAAATEILAEGRRSLDYALSVIEDEGIDCDFRRTGRYLAAASPRRFETLAREGEKLRQDVGLDVEIVQKADQSSEIATDTYHGGLLMPTHGAVHPGKLHRGLLAAARRAGAEVVGATPAIGLDWDHARGEGLVATPRGGVTARDIVMAANGYVGEAGRALHAFGRRLISLPSFVVATRPIGRNRIASLTPGGRCYVDTRSVHSYFHADASGDRFIWGGRASLTPIDTETATRRLRGHIRSVFPELDDVGLTHSWTGRIAYTADAIPHLGRLNGIWFAAGYCGSGVAMSQYLGWRLAEKILGTPEGRTGFDAAPAPLVPPYRGEPWFMRVVEAWHKVLDWRDRIGR